MQENAQQTPDFDIQEEYRAIETALLETARGRWFLAEHGRRARRLDSALLEDAIGRLQNSIRQPPALLGLLQAEVEGIRSQIELTRSDLLERASATKPGATASDTANSSTTADTAQKGSSSAPQSGEPGDWQPIDKMLQAAEEIHEAAWSLQAKDINPEACEAIARQASAVYALSMHQASHSSRILKLADALDATGERIEGVLETIAHELQVDETQEAPTRTPDPVPTLAAPASEPPALEMAPAAAPISDTTPPPLATPPALGETDKDDETSDMIARSPDLKPS